MRTVEVRLSTLLWCTAAMIIGAVGTLVIAPPWSADAAVGDADATYVPTPGCRLLDTRPGDDNVGPRTGPLTAGEVMEVAIHGQQGRCTGDLAIPDGAIGVSLNATGVGATAQTNLRLYPADLTDVPLLANLNVAAGAPPTPNKVDVRLSAGGAIKVYNFQGSVHLVLDVVGYYTSDSLIEIFDRLDALEADRGFVMSHGYGPRFRNNADPAAILHFPDRVRVSAPSGFTRAAELPLTAPSGRRLRFVFICADPTPGGTLERVQIHGWAEPRLGQFPDDPAELIVEEEPLVGSSGRCFGVSPPTTAPRYDAYNLTVWVSGTNGVDFRKVESHW